MKSNWFLRPCHLYASKIRLITLAPDDLGYEEELNYIVDKALRSYRGYGLKQA